MTSESRVTVFEESGRASVACGNSNLAFGAPSPTCYPSDCCPALFLEFGVATCNPRLKAGQQWLG